MDLIREYYDIASHRVDVNFIAENSLIWLKELFNLEDYDYNSQRMFEYYPDFLVKFIRNELILKDGVIKLIFPRGMYDENNRLTYKQVTAYFMLNQHYSKLKDIQKDERIKDGLSRLGMVDDLNSIKNTAPKTQWRLYADDPARQYIWAGEEYEPSTKDCVQIGIEVTTYTDYKYTNQERNREGDHNNYVNYLLSQGRNTLRNFTSSNAFWSGAVQLTRRNDLGSMENHIVAHKDWLLFCLALGMDDSVFYRLIDLQQKKFGNRSIQEPVFPIIGKYEEKMLKQFLMDAHWRLIDAKRAVGNSQDKYAISRRMILNANNELIENGLNPIQIPH